MAVTPFGIMAKPWGFRTDLKKKLSKSQRLVSLIAKTLALWVALRGDI